MKKYKKNVSIFLISITFLHIQTKVLGMSINQFLDQLGNENKNEYAEFPNTLSETDDNKDPDKQSKW